MSKPSEQEIQERLVEAYDQMLGRAKKTLEHVREDGIRSLKHELAAARDKAVELGELTRTEAQNISRYLQRDLEDAAQFLDRNREELSAWLQFDIELLEQQLADVFPSMVDHTREALDQFAAQADAAGWKTGEVVGPGTLHCENCGQQMHFHKTGHIPPCPKCRHTHYSRTRE